MTVQSPAMLYTQAFGSRPEDVEIPIIENHDPGTFFVPGLPLGKRWTNTINNTVWELTSVATVAGVTTPTWTLLGIAAGALNTLTGDVGGAVVPVGGNINVQGGASGAISFSNGGAGQLNAAVQVDGVTITIVGDQLVATGGADVARVAVQAATAPGTNPVVPLAGTLTINGASVGASGIPVRSDSIAANTLQIEVQRASQQAVSAAANAGLSSFSSAQFAVDANGFVTMANGLPSSNFPVQASTAPGTNPVVPSAAGAVSINGAAVAASGIPVRSDSIAVNALQIEVQRASQQAASSAANAGLASFNNTEFTVDANGFVSILGGAVTESFTVDAFTPPGTNPVVPTGAGIVTVHGTSVAAAGIPVRTDSLAANSYQVEVQRASQQVASSAANAGLASFNSAQFTVDANGFVTSLTSAESWIDQAVPVTMTIGTGYFVTAAVAVTLPAALQGNIIEIVDEFGGGVVVTAAGGQTIRLGNVTSSVGGTATSTQRGDALRLVFRAAVSTWIEAPGSEGNWILA